MTCPPLNLKPSSSTRKNSFSLLKINKPAWVNSTSGFVRASTNPLGLVTFTMLNFNPSTENPPVPTSPTLAPINFLGFVFPFN